MSIAPYSVFRRVWLLVGNMSYPSLEQHAADIGAGADEVTLGKDDAAVAQDVGPSRGENGNAETPG